MRSRLELTDLAKAGTLDFPLIIIIMISTSPYMSGQHIAAPRCIHMMVCMYPWPDSNPEHYVSRRTGAWIRRGCAEHKRRRRNRNRNRNRKKETEKKRNEGMMLTLDT